MKRKYFSVLLMGALAVASTSMVTSCKDYDDDINNLQSQIDQLNKIIEQIKSEITAGSVITKVENTSTGVDITLSNGEKYSITNGLNGKDGKDGVNGQDGAPGTAWTISEDGYWVKDGVKTEYKALGQDGKDGKDGLNGQDGKDGKDGKDGLNGQDGKDGKDGLNGQDGKDGKDGLNGDKGDKGDKGETGNYYKPNAQTGMFDLCDSKGNVIETTNIPWKGNGVTAVMDNNNLTLYNVADKNGVVDANGVQIALSNNLRGFVFEKDNSGRVYVDGVPGIRVSSFSFYAQKLDKADSQSEKSVKVDAKEAKDVVNPTTYAYYHVNPSNANVEDLKKLNFVVKANADYITTRGAASEDFAAKAEFVEFKDGILKVKVDMTGEPATAEKISVVALQATKDNKETVTSDYATLYKQDMKELRLANKKKFEETKPVDYHFRRAAVGIDVVDNAAGVKAKTWSTQDGSDTDLDLQYDESIDLNNYVQAHEIGGTTCSVADLEALGFGINYEVVKNYKIGKNNTDQADFVNLEGSELSAKVFSDPSKKFAAVGRTPIIRASIYNKSNKHVVEYAYIKVNIVKKAVENKNIDLTIDNFAFDCTKSCVLKSTVEQINVQLYNEMNMDRDEFHNTYTYFNANNATGQVGTVEELTENIDGETTHLLQWTMTPDEMWANADKDVTHECYYKVAETSNRWVKITLKAHVNNIKKTYDLTPADFIKEYWNSDKSVAIFNVNTPDGIGVTDNTKCVFVNDLNSPFTTKEGKLKLDEFITNFTYSFCKDIEKVTKVGNITVKFAVGNNGTTLNATVAGKTEKVATISNTGSAVPFNTVTLNKASEIAKKLLNTGEFKVYYSVKANACNDATKEVKVTFNGADHFVALFKQPVDIATKSKDSFEDGVDFGEKGTYLKLEDLIAPSDWRGRSFEKYANYWEYYGPFTITPDLENATCDLTNGENPDGTKHIAVPATIKLETVPAGTLGSGDNEITSKYGFVSYKNNGTVVTSDFNIYVKVKVDYGWGTIVTGEIAVPVKKTTTAK